MKRHIPNALTCCNLLCGCLAILQALQGHLFITGYFVAAALVFDFLDGFAARKLKVVSPIGKDLDSLADMVTFGVVPGMVMYTMINLSCWTQPDETVLGVVDRQAMPLAYVGLIIPIFSAIRLARFNNDPRQGDTFFGLPTPANAMVICSLPFIAGIDKHGAQPESSWILHPWLLCGLSLVMSLLLVSGLPLFALKFKNFGWKGNRHRYLFLICAVAVLAVLGITGVPVVILLYVAWSLVYKILSRKPA